MLIVSLLLFLFCRMLQILYLLTADYMQTNGQQQAGCVRAFQRAAGLKACKGHSPNIT